MANEMQSYLEKLHAQFTARERNAMSDYRAGARDCANGIYDKWYRYNSFDDGEAYNIGWVEQNEITENDTVLFIGNKSLF